MIARTPRPRTAAALVLLLACGPKSNLYDGDSTSQETTAILTTTGSAGTTDATTTTAPNPTSEPNPTSATSTTTTTTDPNPTTSAASDSGPLDFGAPPFCGDFTCEEDEWMTCSCPGDCGGCPLPPPLTSGCPEVWTGGSAVGGMTAFGALDGHTAFFGWQGFGDTQWSELRLFIFDASVDLEAAKQSPFSGIHFSLQLSPHWNQPEWINKGVVDGAVVRDGKNDSRQALLAVTGTAGNWQMSDPTDPPRLLGVVLPASPDDPQPIEGPFDAVFCDVFGDFIIAE